MRKKSFWTFGLVACLAVVSVGFAGTGKGPEKGGQIALDGTFRDDPTDRVRSDVRGPYRDGDPGIRVGIESNGVFGLTINLDGKGKKKSNRDGAGATSKSFRTSTHSLSTSSSSA